MPQNTLKFCKENRKFVLQRKSIPVCVGGETVGNIGTQPKRGKHCSIRREGGKVGRKTAHPSAIKPPGTEDFG